MAEKMSVSLSGNDLLSNAFLNKGQAFTKSERRMFGLSGALPQAEHSLEDQVKAAQLFLKDLPTPLARYIRLREIQDSNETLFYALLDADIEAMLPLVYTPTVGEACQKFSELWQKPRGIFLSYPEREQMRDILANPAFDDVRVIVVSDGERILGLGDQGAGGMGIPIGKLSLYTACAGIAPNQTLPILLDTGTNNQERLDNPNYIGWRHERIRGAEYDAFIDQFVTEVKRRWPHILLQWEDFANPNAAPILERYRDKICSFNDDIQGTASVAVGAILAANQANGRKLHEQTIVMLGGGSAGVGIARLLVRVMCDEGVSEEQARRQFYMLDKDGLLTTQRDNLDVGQKLFARSDWENSQNDLATVVSTVKPSILIGVSGVSGLFKEDIIREMAEHCERPIIFPLSNPTSHAEATPEDILKWTKGRALVSTGSPFPAIEYNGKKRRVDQTNNSYIFPGMGLGILACEATSVTENMFMAAAQQLANLSPLKKDPEGNLLPPVHELKNVAISIAEATAKQAQEDGVCKKIDDNTLKDRMADLIWQPVYREYIKK
ncbi:NAD-dependent malic enzyme [Swingsia samuiensis]|uniref:Malolactic enzyme n=1 Tax=Swingsia samuiensis TaxID=1293412 RepID=A0A4Y6UJX7_9PROT|nr:NAD-dependent malic enzyme [Swingsia samuiensis]QDH17364.1 NAD-dependent malic enzyme [Swingsia samuiensis]